jgi:hypothetical protein
MLFSLHVKGLSYEVHSLTSRVFLGWSGSQMVLNVEYNQLDPLLRATGHADGDVNDASGYSPYPGNINQVSVFFFLCWVFPRIRSVQD